MTDPVRLDGDGPFLLPAVAGFLGLGIERGQLPVQMRFALEDGSELRIPIAEVAYEKLLAQFAALHAERQKNVE